MSSVENASSASTATFTTALWLNAAVFGAEIIAFTLLLHRFRAIYEPRTYIPAENKRAPPIPRSILAWPMAVWCSDYDKIKEYNGLDAYFFVRYLRMMVKIFLPIWLISWAVLLPTVSVGSSVGLTGLDRFTFGNVSPSQPQRYAAHIILVWGFTIYIFYVIKQEMRNFVTTRQRHLVDPVHSASAQANTVLITGVPPKFLSEKALTRLFSHLPGGVKKVWLNRDLKELPDIYDRRLAASNKLESAETALLNTAAKLRRKELKKSGKEKKVSTGSADALSPNDQADVEKTVALAERLVPKDQRPSHRLPAGFMPFSLPFIGQKVDTIEWARDEILKTTEALERGRAVLRREVDETLARQGKVGGIVGGVTGVVSKLRNGSDQGHGSADGQEDGKGKGALAEEGGTYPPLSSAFILFNQQIAAHMASQILIHNEPYRMATKYTEVAPEDVIWGNLGLNPYEMKIRRVISYGMTAGLILLWAFPVAFVGIVSNIAGLCKTYRWLAWLCKLPDTVLGILQGVLPPAGLAILMMLLPIILRLLARFEGIPRRTGLELSLMTRFFLFQVLHGFLIVTLSSGIIAALPGLVKNPGSIPSLLASNLPKASNFFLTYAILQGLTGTAAGFLQIVPLIVYYVKLYILGSTPRSVYNIKNTMRNVAWGTLFPSVTLITVISLSYSIIAPIINGLACATFFLFFQMYKYLFTYQFDQPPSGDTGGLFFPKAIQHMFVGLYVQQICLAALFFLARNDAKNPSAVPEGALMIVLIVVTAFYNILINNSYGPLLHALPLTLAEKSYSSGAHPHEASIAEGDREHNEFAKDGDDAPAAVSAADDGDSGLSGSKPVGKQPIKTDFGAGVGVEGKRNAGPTDFNHPASVEAQRVIWLPRDLLGLAEAEVRDLNGLGIEASAENAGMDEKGHVDVDGPPPGM